MEYCDRNTLSELLSHHDNKFDNEHVAIQEQVKVVNESSSSEFPSSSSSSSDSSTSQIPISESNAFVVPVSDMVSTLDDDNVEFVNTITTSEPHQASSSTPVVNAGTKQTTPAVTSATKTRVRASRAKKNIPVVSAAPTDAAAAVVVNDVDAESVVEVVGSTRKRKNNNNNKSNTPAGSSGSNEHLEVAMEVEGSLVTASTSTPSSLSVGSVVLSKRVRQLSEKAKDALMNQEATALIDGDHLDEDLRPVGDSGDKMRCDDDQEDHGDADADCDAVAEEENICGEDDEKDEEDEKEMDAKEKFKSKEKAQAKSNSKVVAGDKVVKPRKSRAKAAVTVSEGDVSTAASSLSVTHSTLPPLPPAAEVKINCCRQRMTSLAEELVGVER